ncbi:MAG TPA: FxLYD domain-containing protein [Anaerolineae bacterium]|nr:FxLYD domain-containing protein [Anaerolineae bacterium]HQH37493.1 FxLYD domain-containing protein [Anaerolineae bacterium]
MLKNRMAMVLLGLIFVAMAVTGCTTQQPATEASSTTEAPAYTGALRTDYENALDVTGQLALGILRLEGTADAITAEQATQALPLWKTLQGTTLSTQAERLAVTKQLEDLLSATQLAAITAMQLTEDEAQTWLQEQGPTLMGTGAFGQGAGAMPGSGTAPQDGSGPAGMTMSEEDRAAMREKFENMTEEERANMRAQFGQGGTSGGSASGSGMPSGGFAGANSRVSSLLTRAVVTLLTERSGQVTAAVTPSTEEPSAATEPAVTATAATVSAAEGEGDVPVTIITLVPWRTPEPEATATPTPAATQASTTNTSASVPASPAASTTAQPAVPTETVVAESSTTPLQGALTQKIDTDPAPPLTIEITTNYAEQNPLLESGLIYHIGGYVHNPTDETYEVTAVHVTFFDADGFRGAFYAFPMRPGQRGIRGEWIWHGAMEAEISCSVLGPGESCPFTAEIAGQNMASFLVHPDAQIAEWHEAVAVTLSDTKIEDTGTNYVRISGTATNPNPYPLKNIVISGLLVDANGQMVSMGTGVVTSLAAGASAPFEVYVENKAHVSYQLHALAEQDAK